MSTESIIKSCLECQKPCKQVKPFLNRLEQGPSPEMETTLKLEILRMYKICQGMKATK